MDIKEKIKAAVLPEKKEVRQTILYGKTATQNTIGFNKAIDKVSQNIDKLEVDVDKVFKIAKTKACFTEEGYYIPDMEVFIGDVLEELYQANIITVEDKS